MFKKEVQKFTCVTSSSTRSEEAESGKNSVVSASNEGKENDDDPWEEERSWRDPSAHSLRSVVIDWDNIQSTRRMQVSILTPNHTSTNF
jgi:U3 small nucleolar RNA-associated protein 20